MKITVISLDNWGYNKYIIDELNTYDFIETNHINFDTFIYQYPSIFHRIFNFFLKSIFNFNLKRNHLNKIILNQIKKLGHQDKILVIKSDFLSIKTIKKLKENTSELIAFYNDNIERCPRIKQVYSYFDTNYSFERTDVEKYSFNFISNYIYHDHLSNKPDLKTKTIYEVFNISSIGKRNNTIENIAIVLDKINIKYKIIIVGKKDYQPKGQILYQGNKIDIKGVNQLISESRTLLDVHRKGQSGLTFRVLDSLAYQKKLITTNPDIKNYDFYNPKNILIIDSENVKIPSSFFKNDYETIPQDIYYNYTSKNWVKTVFQLN
tara:strand:- start:13815 stop:14777 length:963 start_codon:yes stop_codon:yes gene_type:complete